MSISDASSFYPIQNRVIASCTHTRNIVIFHPEKQSCAIMVSTMASGFSIECSIACIVSLCRQIRRSYRLSISSIFQWATKIVFSNSFLSNIVQCAKVVLQILEYLKFIKFFKIKRNESSQLELIGYAYLFLSNSTFMIWSRWHLGSMKVTADNK